jgi:hypothetical protein
MTKRALEREPPTSDFEQRIRQVHLLVQIAAPEFASVNYRKRNWAEFICKIDKLLTSEQGPLHEYRGSESELLEQVILFRRDNETTAETFGMKL